MPETGLPLPDKSPGPAEDAGPGPVDLQALAEKVVALLRREIEIETERCGKILSGR